MPAQDLLTHPPRLPLVAPSILSADFARMAEDCAHILSPAGGGADLLHLDVMDGHFVPNLTMGPDLCRCLHAALPEAYLDVHLMVTDPEKYFEPFAKAGAHCVTFHIEVTPHARVRDLVARAHTLGLKAGLAINPPTPADAILPVLSHPDMILVMSVNPGFSGQAFIDESLTKTRAIRNHLGPHQRLQMDGGIGPAQAEAVRTAGCDVLVAASAIFKRPKDERAEVVRQLRGENLSRQR
ncbi:MAG: ribulose-phosphate 3-epimerase [Phycisphaerales bacterium]